MASYRYKPELPFAMPRSFLVKQQEKSIDEKRNDEDSNAPELSEEPPVPSLPPPLLKVYPRTPSRSLWVTKDDRPVPKLLTRPPTESSYQSSIKRESELDPELHDVQSYTPMRSLRDSWLHSIDSKTPREKCRLDDLPRHHDFRGVSYGQEQKFHLQQRIELEKKGILSPLYSSGMYADPFMYYPHSLYTNTGLYGTKENTVFKPVNMLSKYYMSMPALSTHKAGDTKEQSVNRNEDAKTQVNCCSSSKPESSINETNVVQSSQGRGDIKSTDCKSEATGTKVEQPASTKKYRYTCDVCGKSFSRSNTLTTHKRIHTGAKPFICEQCGRAFRQPGNLTRHRLTHTAIKPYVCTQCNKAFNRASNLHTHMRTHTNYKPFVCDFCGKGFHQKIDMKIHRYTHTGEKPHKCTKCGRGFKQLTHLTYHMRTHSDERLYKCEYCGKGFNQKGNLQAHIYGHTGERPFKCDVCGKGFTLASTLNTHKRTHATRKPFDCQFCGKAFYQKNALKTHYIASHPFANGMSLL